MTARSKKRIVALVGLSTKSILIVGVILAILYVLISPLPEMAATKSGGGLTFLAPSRIWFVLAVLHLPVRFASGQPVVGYSLSRSLLCSRLC